MQKNPLADAVKSIENFKNNMKEATKHTKDVKEGSCTPEDEQKEPAYILYDGIADGSISILESPVFIEGFKKISDKLGDEVSRSLAEMLAIAMTKSAYSAITFYDDLLKAELQKQFDNYGSSLNGVIAKTNGINGAMEVFKKRIGDMENKLKIDSIKE